MFINICYFLILIVILYLLFYYCDYNGSDEEFNKNYFNLTNDTDIGYNMEKIICSKKCCSTDWPNTTNNSIDPKIDMNKYLPTNLNCNDGIHDTGCVCKKKN
jgi:hypothetical protein